MHIWHLQVYPDWWLWEGKEASWGYVCAQKEGSISGHTMKTLTHWPNKFLCQCTHLQVFRYFSRFKGRTFLHWFFSYDFDFRCPACPILGLLKGMSFPHFDLTHHYSWVVLYSRITVCHIQLSSEILKVLQWVIWGKVHTRVCWFHLCTLSQHNFQSVLMLTSRLQLPNGQNLTDNVYSSSLHLEAM